ncbi:unnamed protein product, partial [Brenthis ino]
MAESQNSDMCSVFEENVETNIENLTELEAGSCSNRADKRSRDIDTEEVWAEVGRRGKVMARSNNNNDTTPIPEEQIEISMVSRKEKLPKQIGLARLLKNENIKNITRIKYVNAYKVFDKIQQF